MKKYHLFARKLIRVFRLNRLLEKDIRTQEMVEIIYRRRDKGKVLDEIWHQRILMVLGALGLCGLFLAVCVAAEEAPEVIQDGSCIVSGGNTDLVTFGFRAETEDGVAEDEITVDLTPDETPDPSEQSVETELSPREKMIDGIREAVETAVARQKGKRRILLPQTVSGSAVEYVNPENNKDFSAFYLSLSVLLLLPFLWKRQCEQKLEEREKQLSLDYPELVHKTVLLLSAGLTIRGCFERIHEEYTRQLAGGGKRRYVYEEVCVSCQEMKNGVPEPEVIETFGKRCRQLPYLKFSSIINQNIRKGAEGLTKLLEIEAMEAFEKRKETVKRMGETAGTKLLLPMMLMLGVVMAIIIIPAFMTM